MPSNPKGKGSMFQSEDMTLVQVILPREMTYFCVSQLGETGKLYFRDLNPHLNPYSRAFVNEVRRCDDLEKELRFFAKELEKVKRKMKKSQDIPAAPPPGELSELEVTVSNLSKSLHEVTTSSEVLTRNMNELVELKYILEKTSGFFDEKDVDLSYAVNVADTDNIVTPGENRTEFGHVTGVILREKLLSFEQLLWRACRGNVHMRQEEIDVFIADPQTGLPVAKCAFIIFFQGEHLRSRVKKICDGFHATLYTIPDVGEERREMLAGVKTRIADLTLVINQTNEHRTAVIKTVATNLWSWIIKIRKIKAIYHVMNQLDVDVTQTLLIGEGWVPVFDLDIVRDSLKRGQVISGCSIDPIMNEMEHHLNPPTYFRTNKFTKIFQSIVSAYGVPRYKEVNPALYTVITFPFLFSVMFGDAGDAIIMILFAMLLIIFEDRLGRRGKQDVFNMWFGGRYIILLMGLFSIYSGIMYNDIFSISFNIFGTAWYPNTTNYNINTDLRQINSFELNPNAGTDYSGYPYPFGMDPVWMLAQNSITWLNSFKMKMSVIMGVSQMFFGICLSLVNNIYFRNWVNVFCEFIPQVIFITCIFGYMNILIFFKWIYYNASMSACAPTILVDMIDMFLLQYPKQPCYSAVFYPSQKMVQDILLICAALCVPWILIPKPLILRYKHNRELMEKGDAAVAVGVDEVYGVGGRFKTLGTEEIAYPVVLIDGHEALKLQTPASSRMTKEVEAALSSSAGQTSSSEIKITVDQGQAGTTITVTGVPNAATLQANAERSKAFKERPDEFEEEEFEFSEIFVHQAIHTIEYCLGCISHTASYLRLWALSLAHAELAEVLWIMVLRFGFITKGWLGIVSIFFLFPAWAVLTIAILLMMEGLSAFLHTLRLHWVEFQSKFYGGIGHKFLPFSYNKVLKVMWEEYSELNN